MALDKKLAKVVESVRALAAAENIELRDAILIHIAAAGGKKKKDKKDDDTSDK